MYSAAAGSCQKSAHCPSIRRSPPVKRDHPWSSNQRTRTNENYRKQRVTRLRSPLSRFGQARGCNIPRCGKQGSDKIRDRRFSTRSQRSLVNPSPFLSRRSAGCVLGRKDITRHYRAQMSISARQGGGVIYLIVQKGCGEPYISCARHSK